MSLASERRTVQNPFIRYVEEAGWDYRSPDEARRLRGGDDSPILRAVFLDQIQRLNSEVVTSTPQAEEVLARLIRVRPNIKGNLEAWEYLRGLKTWFVEAERRERNLRLLDPDHPEQNAFHVTDEFASSAATPPSAPTSCCSSTASPSLWWKPRRPPAPRASPKPSTKSAVTTTRRRSSWSRRNCSP